MFIGKNIRVLNSVDSTNKYVKENHADLADGEIVVAKMQTAGRGRFSRKWISDEGNLYCSFIVNSQSWLETPTQLPIFIAVVLRRAILDSMSKAEDIRIGFKWPNDILGDGGKLSGTLIESLNNSYVVGIGVNILSAPLIPQARTTSLVALYGKEEIKEAADLINFFVGSYNAGVKKYLSSGFAPFKSDWERFCVHLDKKVALKDGINDNTQQVEAVFKGLDVDGGARVIFEQDRKEKTIYYGELDV